MSVCAPKVPRSGGASPNKVNQRFPDADPAVGELADITRADIQLVEREMSRCSTFEHDEPGAMNQGIPDPDVIRRDLRTLEEWVENLRARGRRN
jgi:hypothetical protein